MIRRSPCEAYTKYLIVTGKTDAEIKELLMCEQLDYLSASYMVKLREQCRTPDPFYPRDVYHHPSQTFLSREGIRGLFFVTAEVRAAHKILRTPRAKEFTEAMLLSGASSRAIAIALTRQKNLPCTDRGVDAYKNYFWNVDLVDSIEMKALLVRRVERLSESSDPDVLAQAKAMKNASYTDSRRAAAAMPHSPISAMIAQMRMGFMPKNEELSQLVEHTRVFATARSLEATNNGGPEDSMKALNYAIVAEKMGNILEQIVKPDEDLLEKLSSINLTTQAAHAVPTIHNLSSGRHTVDMEPREEVHEPAPKPPE